MDKPYYFCKGWPTPEMVKAGADMFGATLHSAAGFDHHATHVFNAMIAAAPSAGKPSEQDAIEVAAKAIYQLLDGAGLHPWVEGGNSFKQDEARRYARAAITTKEAGK